MPCHGVRNGARGDVGALPGRAAAGVHGEGPQGRKADLCSSLAARARHFWVAFVAFAAALVLGEWQMYVRSPLSGWVGNPEHYYRAVTAHGTVMGYVLPTLVAMGFGYAITSSRSSVR